MAIGDREWDVVLMYHVASEHCFTKWRLWEIVECNARNPAEILGDLMEEILVPALQAPCSAATVFDAFYLRAVAGPPEPPRVHLLGQAGGGGGDALPPNSTVVVTWYTMGQNALGPPRHRSNGFSGTSEGFQIHGLLNNSGQDFWNTVAQIFFAGFSNPPGSGGGRWYPVFPGAGDPLDRSVEAIVARPNLSTRRSRRRRYGSG